VVIVVEPEVLRDADELVGAVRAYHPSVAVWRYSRGASPRLDKWNGGVAAARDDNGRGQGRPSSEAEAPATAPRGMAEGTSAIDGDATGQPAAEPGTTQRSGEEEAPLLTDAELAMLLGEDEEDQCPGRKRDDLDDDG